MTDAVRGDESMYELFSTPTLDAPVLVLALDGWIDAGLGAATAYSTLASELEMKTIAGFDTDRLLDHRSRRPVMHLVDGLNTGLTWPAIELRVAVDRHGTEALVLAGAEPDHEWRRFCATVVDLAVGFGTRLVVGLGAYPAPTPHTRPARVVATATTRDLADAVGFVHGAIDVPAGVHGAIERECAARDLGAVGLWAQVPHYASGMPYPAASMALLEALGPVADLHVGTGDLPAQAAEMRERLDELVASNPDHVRMVRQLEEHVDAIEPSGAGGSAAGGGRPGPPFGSEALPSGEELAAELEQFLRDQGN